MFPLGTVLLPGSHLALHVFEPRYRELVRVCLEGTPEFGVALIERGAEVGGGGARFGVGCVARIVEAVPFAPARVLDLGIGTGETSRRLLEAYPDAQITGLDSSPEMVFRARELGIEVRLARMEDPLPDGPWTS